MKIICTAGHIDHGKTSLISAISGFWGDSTPQERERGITIDLSFSDYQGISFIDVPGHEQLLRTMLRGVASKYALLVIDINEGVMPQTAEHIFALQIMGAEHIILALNKCDLCEDIEVKKTLILESLKDLNCHPAAVFTTSAKTGASVQELKDYLLALPESKDASKEPLRLYVDRVFKVAGVGDVATGFLKSGVLEHGVVYALKEQIKIRSLQAQHQEVECIKAPARAAFAYKGELGLNSVISTKGALKSSKQIHASIIRAPHAKKLILESGARAFFASFNQQAPCRVYAVGEFVRLEFERGVVCNFDDPYVLLANGRCVAGGRVLSPVIEPLKKSKMIELLNALCAKNFATAFRMLNAAHGGGFGLFCAEQRFGISTKEALKIANEHCELVNEVGANCFSAEFAAALEDKIKAMYEKNPFSMQSAASLAKSFQTDEFICAKALANMSNLRCEQGLYVRKDVDFQQAEKSTQEQLFAAIDQIAPLAPYNIYEQLNLDNKKGDDYLKALTRSGKVVRLAHNYFISARALKMAVENMSRIGDGVGVQEVKDALNLSRKYAIALLEYVDKLDGVKTVENKRYFGQNFKFK